MRQHQRRLMRHAGAPGGDPGGVRAATRRRIHAGGLYPDNGALLRACREGDPHAWREIVARYERLVYAIPLNEGLDVDQAADIAQETFATLMAGLDRISQPDRLGSWLMTVARRLSWRERHRRSGVPLGVDVVEGLTEQDLAPDSVTELWVYEAVQSLAEPCRSLVLSLFFDPAEPSYAEVAVRLGRPLGSIGPLRARCLDRLRDLLEGA